MSEVPPGGALAVRVLTWRYTSPCGAHANGFPTREAANADAARHHAICLNALCAPWVRPAKLEIS